MVRAFLVLHSVWETLGFHSEADTIRFDLLSNILACRCIISLKVFTSGSMTHLYDGT